MKCELDFCIYNRELTCILGEIHIDALGKCEECETVFLPKEILEKYKWIRLQEILGRRNNYDT